MAEQFRGDESNERVVRCEPALLDIKSAREFFGGISENTLRDLLAEYGVKPVYVFRRVMWYVEDLRRVALLLPRSAGAEGAH